MGDKSAVDWIAGILVIIGALNWGLIAISVDYNVVEMLLGAWPVVVRVVYGLVGLSGIWMIYAMFKN